jgi:hypothetical protein
MRHVHELEVVGDPLAPLGAALLPAENLVHGELDILPHGEPGQEGMVLEHDRPLRTGCVHFPALEQHRAFGHLQEPGDEVEERGLAAPGMADDGDVFTPLDLEVDVAQHLRADAAALEGDADMVDLEIGHRVLHSAFARHAVPRVRAWPRRATRRSSTKPTTPT